MPNRHRPIRLTAITLQQQPNILSTRHIKKIVTAVLAQQNATHACSLTIRFADKTESQQLNHLYRQKNYATNILSFSYDDMPHPAARKTRQHLGDLVICLDILHEEASNMHISTQQHLTHLLVHGVLHLLGYDHEVEAEATAMEHCEITILTSLGITSPYADA